MIADIEELEEMDASEIHARRVHFTGAGVTSEAMGPH